MVQMQCLTEIFNDTNILFGSDTPIATKHMIDVAIKNINTIFKKDEIIEKILYNNAADLLFITLEY